MARRTDLADGYHRVPPGKLANAVTWLEMCAPPPAGLADPLALAAVTDAERALCQELFVTIGTPWLWSSAYEPMPARFGDVQLARDDMGTPVGIVEFVGRAEGDVEILYFGLVPAAVGKGLGRRMMAAVLDLAWRSARRVWLHTCNFDHPGALRFYKSCGFVPYAAGFEIMDDPRLVGSLPIDAAPHVPLIGAARPIEG